MRHLTMFLCEEEAQGNIEYYLLLGSAIIAAVILASSYYKIAYKRLMRYNETISSTYDELCRYVAKYLESEVSTFCSP